MTGFIDFLLGNRLHEWIHGTFSFQSPLRPVPILAAAALLILVVWFLYRRTTVKTPVRLKTILVVFKSAAILVLFFCLLQPTLTTSSLRPEGRTLGLLIDNSRSMTIRDMARSRSRGEAVADLLYGSGDLVDRLRESFTLRIFSFDRSVRPVSGARDLTFAGTLTDTAAGMQTVAEAFKGQQPGALVLVTDGADNGGRDPLRMAGIFNTRNIPVYVVGVGSDKIFKDLEISSVTTTGPVIEGGIFEVQATVTSRGYEGRNSEVRIEDGEQLIAQKKITLGPDGSPARYTFQLTPEKEGPIVYTVRISEQKDEIIKENNRMEFIVDNRSRPARVLYVEGHPRNEYKFIRRAAAADKAVSLKTYLKTGPQKFLRQDIESPAELSGGFPSDEEDLFAYDAIIFGDIPRNFFTSDQLKLTREFVSRRGGGFLMLGGSTAFDEGFIGTPIEDILPVTLVPERDLTPDLRGGSRRGAHPTGQKYTPLITSAGIRSALLRLGADEKDNRKLWREMPQLQGVNVTGRTKPGATVLAVHPVLKLNENPLPIVAHQRYGRGRTMAITTATTWRWQMLMPHEDASHEKIWRQILRWLTTNTPSRVEIELDRNRYSSDDTVQVRARVHDPSYQPVNNAAVWLKISGPDGRIQDLQLTGNLDQKGDYIGAFNPSLPGKYQLEVSASDTTLPSGFATAHFLVTDALHEYRDGALNSELLNNIARAGGGKYYTYQDAGQVAKDLEKNRAVQTVHIQLDIWDVPAVFLFLIACYALEWILRRRKGLS